MLTVVDVVNIPHHLSLDRGSANPSRGAIAHSNSSTNEVVKQIAYADRILLNKMDLLPADPTADPEGGSAALEATKRQIRAINPNIEMITCVKGMPNGCMNEMYVSDYRALRGGGYRPGAEHPGVQCGEDAGPDGGRPGGGVLQTHQHQASGHGSEG